MDSVRVVSLASLRRRLNDLLAGEPLLRQRFDRALAARDATALDDAFRCLRLYPEATRRSVEEAIFAWLFGEQGEALPAPVARAEARSHRRCLPSPTGTAPA